MIFVHSSWRTASTYLWSLLRGAPRTVAYCEIFHETLHTLSRAQLTAASPEAWYSKHPPGAPYFLEFLPLLRPGGGVEGFDPSMSTARFIPPDGCGGALGDAELAYVARLIAHAEDRGRIPVLTATRSLGRLRGLKAAFPGLHVLLYRNLFQQWCSFTEQAFRGNPYFLGRVVEIIAQNRHDDFLAELQELFPVATVSPENPNLFYSFAFLHLHLYVQSAGAAGLIVDVNRLSPDPAHRREVEAAFAGQDVGIDLSGAVNSIAYSLCPLGSAADVAERLKVIGEAVIDRAPDEAGRRFGAKVLTELIEEHARHEFQAGALRSVLLGPTGLLAERDRLRAERDAARDPMRQNASEKPGRKKRRK